MITWAFSILAIILGFYLAWNIGANDVANSMGTSIGSGVITVRKAIYLAAILNVLGAILVGGHVTKTISKDIIDPDSFSLGTELFIYGMLSAVLATSIWITAATYLGLPVSTTHSIIGAIAGFGLVSSGLSVINFHKLTTIFASWILSPFAGAMISFCIFTIIKKLVLEAKNPYKATKRVFPSTVSLVLLVISTSILYKSFHYSLQTKEAFYLLILISILSGVLSKILIRHYAKKKKNRYDSAESLFGYLQILSACAVAFSQGSNDVANAVGPLTAILTTTDLLEKGVTLTTIPAGSQAPIWILLFGGFGIAIGISTWGYKVMNTIGEKITDITPTRGFAAEFGTATTVLACAMLGLPISTSHTIVGSVIGVGYARGISALNFEVIKNIVFSWFLTIPIAAILTMIVYSGIVWVL